jgi:hypothetical protein
MNRYRKSNHENGKWCPKCKTVKPLDDFGPDSRSRDGKNSYCYECDRERQRERRRRLGVPEYTPKQTDTHKYCPDCQEFVLLSEYHRDATRPGGYQAYCGKHEKIRKTLCKLAKPAEKTQREKWTAVKITSAQVRREDKLDRKPTRHVCRAYPPFGRCVCGRRIAAQAATD